ncbi:CvpA family protein [Eubacteriales bacterium OttesenSCG-928-G02]|nr:CvpA family protein [Eubacteriales bacterium OttesenSCG-928-G02]
MSALLDIIIVVIIGLTIFFAVKNGFVKTVLSGASFLIAVIIAFSFVSPLKAAFMETKLAESVKETVNETLADMISEDKDDYDPNELKELPEFFEMLEIFGIDKAEMEKKWDSWRDSNTEKLRNDLVEYISEPIINVVVTIVAFLVLFLGSLILLKIVTYILDRVLMLPALKQANKLLGLVVGIVLALVKVYLFCAVINLLLPFGESMDWAFIKSIKVEDTILFNWFTDFNLFTAFFK